MKPIPMKCRGFTLNEVLMVLLIIGILIALAYPVYVDYVRKSYRGEAQQLLLAWAVNQEIWRSSHPEYASTVELPAPTHERYSFSLDNRSATGYLLQANASGDQLKDEAKDDTSCSQLTLSAAAEKLPTSCWSP